MTDTDAGSTHAPEAVGKPGPRERLAAFFRRASSREPRIVRVVLLLLFVGSVWGATLYNFQAASPASFEPDGRTLPRFVEAQTEWVTSILTSGAEIVGSTNQRFVTEQKERHLGLQLNTNRISQEIHDALAPDRQARTNTDPLDEEAARQDLRDFEARLISDSVIRVSVANCFFVAFYAFIVGLVTVVSGPETRRKWADSVYFFGFILTLTSLIIALSSPGRFDGISLQTIVIQNSIALSSTVFALFLRQILTFFIPAEEDSPDDDVLYQLQKRADAAAEQLDKLSTSVSKLDDNVATTGTKLNVANTLLVNEIGQVASELAAKCAEISRIEIDQAHLSKQLADATRTALEQVETNVAHLAETINTGATITSDQAKAVASSLTFLSLAIASGAEINEQKLRELAHAITVGREDTETALAAVSDGIANGHDGITDSIRAFADTLGTAAVSDVQARLKVTTEEIVTAFRGHNRTIAKEAGALAVTLGDVRGGAADLQRANVKAGRSLSAYGAQLDANKKAVDDIAAAFGTLRKNVKGTAFDVEWMKTHDSTLKALSGDISALNAAISTAKSDLSAATASLGTALEDTAARIRPSVWHRFVDGLRGFFKRS